MTNNSPVLRISVKVVNAINFLLFCFYLFLYIFFPPNYKYMIIPNASAYELFVEKMQEFMSPIYPIIFIAFFIVSMILLKRNKLKLSLSMALIPMLIDLITFIIEFICRRVL